MKATGVCRSVDELGRLVLPAELRRALGMDTGALVAFAIEGDRLVLRPYEEGCVFCGSAAAVVRFGGHSVCRNCIAEMPAGQAGAG